MNFGACFLGLGNMGTPIALNLLKNHVELFVYNRSKEKAIEVIAKGAQVLNSPQEAFENAPVVFSMVSDDHALKAITLGDKGLLAKAREGCIHVSMSTVSPKLSQELAEKHREKGAFYVAAPVFGRPEVAAAGKLWICVAGDPTAKKHIEPLLSYVGQKVQDFGENPESANVVKLAGNFLILTVVEALAEAFSVAKKSDIDLTAVHFFLTETLFPSPVFKTYGQLIISQKFEPAGLKMHLGLKDIDLFLRAAESLHIPLPLAGLLHDRLLTGLANHRGELDWSALSLCQFEQSGLLQQI